MRRAVLLAVVLLTTTTTVRADLSSSSWSNRDRPPPGLNRSTRPTAVSTGDLIICEPSPPASQNRRFDPASARTILTGFRNSMLVSHSAPTARPESIGQPVEIRHLPASPDGMSLGLSGLLSMGVLQLVRAGRHNPNPSALPAWYHAAHRRGTARTAVFAVESLRTLCFAPETAAIAAYGFRKYQHESRSRIQPQFVLLAIAPRGPPAIA